MSFEKGKKIKKRRRRRNKRALPTYLLAFNGKLYKGYNRGLCVPAGICSAQLLRDAQMGQRGAGPPCFKKKSGLLFFFLTFSFFFFLLQKALPHTQCSGTKVMVGSAAANKSEIFSGLSQQRG